MVFSTTYSSSYFNIVIASHYVNSVNHKAMREPWLAIYVRLSDSFGKKDVRDCTMPQSYLLLKIISLCLNAYVAILFLCIQFYCSITSTCENIYSNFLLTTHGPEAEKHGISSFLVGKILLFLDVGMRWEF